MRPKPGLRFLEEYNKEGERKTNRDLVLNPPNPTLDLLIHGSNVSHKGYISGTDRMLQGFKYSRLQKLGERGK